MAFNLQPPEDDGLCIPHARIWSSHKRTYLLKYIDAFSTAMKGKWSELHYVDLFAGAGIENVKGRGLEWGSPLIAAQAPKKFARLHLCELKDKRFSALKQRLVQFPQPISPELIRGDANQVVKEIMKSIPAGSLSLAFLDPHGLDLHFSTLQALARRRFDLIVFFPDYVDVIRNLKQYMEEANSKVDRAFGDTTWRRRVEKAHPDHKIDVLFDIYTERIRSLGYRYCEPKRISIPGGAYLYRLIFCSRHPLGARIWRSVARDDADGQRSLAFPE